jgi:purine-binding chemotaxis protein CheW
MQADRITQVQWLTFRLRDGDYALAVSDVVEVLSMVMLAHLPGAPPWLTGMLNLRGQVLPVLDLRLRLGFIAPALTLDTPIVVVRTGDRLAGLIVDEVRDVVSLPAHALAPPDALAGDTHPIAAVARANARLIMLLNLARICDQRLGLANWADHTSGMPAELTIAEPLGR